MADTEIYGEPVQVKGVIKIEDVLLTFRSEQHNELAIQTFSLGGTRPANAAFTLTDAAAAWLVLGRPSYSIAFTNIVGPAPSMLEFLEKFANPSTKDDIADNVITVQAGSKYNYVKYLIKGAIIVGNSMAMQVGSALVTESINMIALSVYKERPSLE